MIFFRRKVLYENIEKYLKLKGKFDGFFFYGLFVKSLLLNKLYYKILDWFDG